MDQVWFGNAKDNLSATTTEYNMLQGGTGWRANLDRRDTVMPSAGSISNLRITLTGTPGAGASYQFTLLVDGVASALTVTIADSATSGADTLNSVAVTAGQLVALECVPTNTPTIRDMTHTALFTGDVRNESVMMGTNMGVPLDSVSNEFMSVMYGTNGASTTEADHEQLVAGSGTVKNLYVKLHVDPGTDPDAYRFTLRKNGVSQTLTVTITANATTGNDTANSFTVAPGDKLSILVEPLNTPSVAPHAAWGVTFEADTDGESLILCGSTDINNASTTEFNSIAQSPVSLLWGGSGSGDLVSRAHGQTCTLRDLHIDLASAPGSGNTLTYTIRLNQATNSNLSVAITGTDTTGSNLVNSADIDDDDEVNIQCVPASGPTVSVAKWGMVQFIGPKAGAVGNIVIRAMVAGGFA